MTSGSLLPPLLLFASAAILSAPPAASAFSRGGGDFALQLLRSAHRHEERRCATSTTRLCASGQDSTENDASGPANVGSSAPLFDTSAAGAPTEDGDWSNFNPFRQQAAASASASSSAQYPTATAAGIATAGTPLSPRTMRMTSLTSELYQHNASPTQMDEILSSHADFLVEQLVDADAVLEVGSVYAADMDLDERRDTYESVMAERIGKARSAEVRRVLVALRDFVLAEVDRRRR